MKIISFIACAAVLMTLWVCSAVSADQGYLIGEEDVLQISVWGNQELNIQVPVRPDGMISFPLVGDVKAAGIGPQELKALLERELSKFIKTPTVSVIVTAINSFKIYVIGEGISSIAGGASNNGVITLKRNTSLLQLLAQLGSLNNADLNNAYVLRDGKKLNTDFYKLIIKGDFTQDLPLKTNDIILIPDNFQKRIMVVGAVRTPGVIQYREGLTVTDAILNTGGFTEFAKQNDVMIIRKEGTAVKNIEARLKDVIQDGDISKDISLKPGDLIIVKTGMF
jgi:polysaccharide export outer membrane protein